MQWQHAQPRGMGEAIAPNDTLCCGHIAGALCSHRMSASSVFTCNNMQWARPLLKKHATRQLHRWCPPPLCPLLTSLTSPSPTSADSRRIPFTSFCAFLPRMSFTSAASSLLLQPPMCAQQPRRRGANHTRPTPPYVRVLPAGSMGLVAHCGCAGRKGLELAVAVAGCQLQVLAAPQVAGPWCTGRVRPTQSATGAHAHTCTCTLAGRRCWSGMEAKVCLGQPPPYRLLPF